MDKYDDIELNVNVDDLVVEQLKTGRYRDRYDSGPSDWLVRAWQNISPAGQQRLSEAIHRALLHESLEVRLGALSALDMCTDMIIPDMILEVATQHRHLFCGARYQGDPLTVDRGRDLLRITAAVAKGKPGRDFRRKMVKDPHYGVSVLASLAYQEPDWAAEHIHELVTPALDPHGTRLTMLVYNLQHRPDVLRRAVANLAARQPDSKARLAETIRTQVSEASLKAELLQLLVE